MRCCQMASTSGRNSEIWLLELHGSTNLFPDLTAFESKQWMRWLLFVSGDNSWGWLQTEEFFLSISQSKALLLEAPNETVLGSLSWCSHAGTEIERRWEAITTVNCQHLILRRSWKISGLIRSKMLAKVMLQFAWTCATEFKWHFCCLSS